ncbi:MAG TPA: ADOP family duplicated permease [Terriglobales bacterium]|nr:ADOP family duplicated permease [Terriglobales bacterium]
MKLNHEELQAHLAALEAEYREQGHTAAEARRLARVRLGGEEQIREERREIWRWRHLDNLGRDLSYALRAIRRAPGFAAVVILTLALGIGANTAVFSVFSAVLLRPLAVANPGQLSLLYWRTPRVPRDRHIELSGNNTGLTSASSAGIHTLSPVETNYSISYPVFEMLEAQAERRGISVFGFAPLNVPETIGVHQSAIAANATLISDGFFAGLGLAPLQGRFPGSSDFRASAPLTAVISYAFWTAQFARSADAVGSSITIERRPATIIGIAPPGFDGLELGQPDAVWLPVRPSLQEGLMPWGDAPNKTAPNLDPRYWWMQAMVRRPAGVAPAQIEAALAPAFAGAMDDVLPGPLQQGELRPQLKVIAGAMGINDIAGQFGGSLQLLLLGVGLLLLLACVNTSALLFAHSVGRRSEIALRLALGAPRFRIMEQLLTESLVLAGLGGCAGVLLTPIASALLVSVLSNGKAIPLQPTLDWRVLGFAAGASLVTGVLFGLLPAFSYSREGGRAHQSNRATADRAPLRAQRLMAAIQIALSLVLLVGASLFTRTLVKLESQPLGFDPAHLTTFDLDARSAGYSGNKLADFYLRLQRQIAALPGVSAATASQHTLLGGDSGGEEVRFPVSADPLAWHDAGRNGVAPDFFATMHIPLLLGRAIEDRDVGTNAPVAVINQALAQAAFGGANPIGRQLEVKDAAVYTIVGVAASTRYATLKGEFAPAYFIPYTGTRALQGLTFEVRSTLPTSDLRASIAHVIARLASGTAVTNFQSQTDQDGATLTNPRLLAKIMSVISLLGLLLAGLGVEGAMAYAVAQRTKEIGIRMALGARTAQAAGDVLRESALVTLAGLAAGLILAVACSRLIAAELYGVSPGDPLTLAGSAAALLVVALAAAWLPARRAAQVDPLIALRSE